MLFCYLLITIVSAQNLINVVLDSSNQYQQVNYGNYTYKLENVNQKYIYAYVQLQKKMNNFYLIGRYGQEPNINSDDSSDQFYDLYGILENRNTRFLEMSRNGQNIYFSLLCLNNVQYTLTIIASNSYKCDANCSLNGLCTANGCECNENFIGTDCHQSAYVVQDDIETVQQLNQEQATFFYYPLKQNTLTVAFELTTNSIYGITISFEQSSYLYVPDPYQRKSYDDQLVKAYSLDQSQTVKVKNPVSQINYYLTTNSYMAFAAVQINPQEVGVVVTITVNPSDQPSLISTTIIIIIIVVVVGVIMIIIILFFVCRHYSRKRNQQLYQSRINGQLYNFQIQLPQLNNNNNDNNNLREQIYNDLKIVDQQNIHDEACSICLESLKNNTIIRQTACHHQFHQDCIKNWLEKQFICPNCRNDLKEVELSIQK